MNRNAPEHGSTGLVTWFTGNFETLLSRPIVWGPVTNRFVPDTSFDEKRVSNMTIVPAVGERYAMMRLTDGSWEMPGGTLEPGERWQDALRREAMEELGALKVIDLPQNPAYDGTTSGMTTLSSPRSL